MSPKCENPNRRGGLRASTALKALVLVVVLVLNVAAATDTRPRLILRSDEPYPGLLIRHEWASVIVMGDYAYIEGGNIFLRGGEPEGEGTMVNVSLSIPLKHSWTNTTVKLQPVSKGNSPKIVRTADVIWSDPETSLIYHWGDYDLRPGDERPATDLWFFKPDGRGGGSWGTKTPKNMDVFVDIYRGRYKSFTTCNRVGYALGGRGYNISDARFKGSVEVPIRGLVTYRMETSIWGNESAPFDYHPWLGQATCLETKDLVVFYGAIRTPNSSLMHFGDWEFSTFRNITIYDPATNRWLWQLATGDIPKPMVSWCSVGVEGPNGTFEIFVFGGSRAESPGSEHTSFGDVWILSLPAFRWFKVNAQTSPRTRHSCGLVGKRQMLVFGGRRNPNKVADNTEEPWSQGIGILDLPTVTWSNKYDADASAYDSPEFVKEWYENGESVNWDSDQVSQLFDPTGQATEKASGRSTGSSVPIAAIVGGTIGGLSFLSAIAGGLFYLRRRKKQAASSRHARNTEPETQKLEKPELSAEGTVIPAPVFEVDAARGEGATNEGENAALQSAGQIAELDTTEVTGQAPKG